MLLALILLSLFFTMLLFPETVFQGACDGLLLWYQILIPTLFPYLIVTGLLLKTDGAAVVSRLLFRPFHLLFGTSFYGSFAVLSGFLCGYPMGAKIIADLLLQGKISLEEASYLLSFCNNASPSFIITFSCFKYNSSESFLHSRFTASFRNYDPLKLSSTDSKTFHQK